MKRSLYWTMVLALALTTGAAAQGNSQGHGKGHGKGNGHNAQRDDDDRGRGHDRDDGRWDRRGSWEYRTYDQGQTPPGWSKGKKTGWGNCNMPPGQAKKYGGCNTYRYQGRDYYWYRDDGGRIILRRPSIHAGVDIH